MWEDNAYHRCRHPQSVQMRRFQVSRRNPAVVHGVPAVATGEAVWCCTVQAEMFTFLMFADALLLVCPLHAAPRRYPTSAGTVRDTGESAARVGIQAAGTQAQAGLERIERLTGSTARAVSGGWRMLVLRKRRKQNRGRKVDDTRDAVSICKCYSVLCRDASENSIGPIVQVRCRVCASSWEVMPLLNAVLDVCGSMPEELFGGVIRDADKCLSQHLAGQEKLRYSHVLCLNVLTCVTCEMHRQDEFSNRAGKRSLLNGLGGKQQSHAVLGPRRRSLHILHRAQSTFLYLAKKPHSLLAQEDSEAFWEPQGESGKTLGHEARELLHQLSKARENTTRAW